MGNPACIVTKLYGQLTFDYWEGLCFFLVTASILALEPPSLLSNGHQGSFPWE